MRTALALAALTLSLLPTAAQSSDTLPAETATAHLEQLGDAGLLVFPQRVDIVPRISLPWAAGTRVRFEQSIDGIPLLGSEIIVSLDLQGRVRGVHGTPIQAGQVSSQPRISSAEAVEAARAFIGAMTTGQGELWSPRSELSFVPSQDGSPRLTWLVDLSVAEPLGIYQVQVDALQGGVRNHRSTLFHAQGNIYPTNPAVSELTTRELVRLPEGAETLGGVYAVVRSCDELSESGFGGTNCEEKSQHASADADGNFLFSPDPTSMDDPLAEVQMYYHLDHVAAWFDETQGFSHGFPTEGIVNFDYNNAFFGDIDGDGIGEVAFGQTNSIDYAYDADVIYHEFGHSVFGRIAGQTGFIGADEYGFQWATGGLNEGTADLFTLVLTGDPNLGEYAGAGSGPLGGGAIRELDEDRHCPTDLYGESHRDGEVFGAFGWNLIEDPELGADFTGDFIYGSVAAFPSDADWLEASDALVETAASMLEAQVITEAQYSRVQAHLQASGLDACGRVIRLDEGQEPTQLMIGVSFFSDRQLPVGQQFSLDAPEGTYRLRFRVKDYLTTDTNLGWTLFVRRGEHIVHELEPVDTPFGTMDIPVPTEFDFSLDGEGSDVDFELDADSDLVLEPGATYYFSLASRQVGNLSGFLTNAEITVDGDAYIDEVAGDDDDDDDDNSDGSACSGCNQLSPRKGAVLAWLLLIPLFLRLRQS